LKIKLKIKLKNKIEKRNGKENKHGKCLEKSKFLPKVLNYLHSHNPSLEILESQDLLILPVKINQSFSNAVLDTGSRKNYISRNLIDRFDYQLRKEFDKGKALISFSISGIEFLEEFYALHNSPGYSLFLGETFLKNNHLHVDLGKNKLVKYDKQKLLWELYISEENCKRVIHGLSCMVKNDYSLLPNKIQEVELFVKIRE